MLPYGRQWVDEEDIQAVVDVLRSEWLTTGPNVERFERAFAEFVGVREAVAVSSGTAALHAAVYATGIGPGDEVIVPALTFAASANCVVFQGGTPVFADVCRDTLLVDPESVKALITSQTKAIIAVDYAGQPCDYDALLDLADHHGLILISDASHSLGATYRNRPVGSIANLSAFSFHPVKHITTGEGGMITTDDTDLARKMKRFRNHGVDCDSRERVKYGRFYYEMVDLGYNYRLSDLQCALGLSQLRKLPKFLSRRRWIAEQYDEALSDIPFVTPPKRNDDVTHAYHLYPVQFNTNLLSTIREEIFAALLSQKIGVNVHYLPVHLHPYYKNRFRTRFGLCPNAEEAYTRLISLPIFPGMRLQDVKGVVDALERLPRLLTKSSSYEKLSNSP